jgi:DNA-binding transcriptional LysR family regulator
MPWDDRTKRRLKLRDLDILLTVIEMGSMGKAAGRLGISQPAISKAIVGLEEALSIKLLDRGRRGVVPTPYGLALAKRGVAIFNDLRQGVQDIDFLSDPTKGEIRIGATEPAAVAFVSPSIDRLSRKYPQTYFHVLTGDGGTLYKNLLDKSIEVAICRMMGPLPEELAAEVVFHDSLVVLSSAKNPLTRRRKLTLAELMDEPWALPPADSFFSSLIDDVFRDNGHQPPRSTVATLSEYMRNDLLATGRFLTVLPGFMLKIRGRHSQLKALPVALPNARMPIGIITLKNRTLTPLAQVFIEALRTTAKSMAQSQ